MTQQIKTILTPVRLYSVEDFRKIAKIACEVDNPTAIEREGKLIELLTRYEEMTRGKRVSNPQSIMEKKFQPALLTKEHFVREVEKPVQHKRQPEIAETFSAMEREYEAAKKKVWFEGFESRKKNEFVSFKKQITIAFTNGYIVLWLGEGDIYKQAIIGCTINDLLYHLDFYNRTATQPIHITPTDSFVEALIDKN